MKQTILLFSVLGLAFAALAGPQTGQPAPNFTAHDIYGKTISPANYKGKVVVMETFYDGCPFCKNHYDTGAMQELQHELATNGVVWLIIDARETPAAAKTLWTNQKMTVTDWIVDADYQVARTYAMKTAPQMFVIDKNGVLAYQGAVDNQPNLDGNPRAARNYVRESVRALLAGKKVSVPETKPYGCRLLYHGMPDEKMFQHLPR
jgi:peroxiredoxin